MLVDTMHSKTFAALNATNEDVRDFAFKMAQEAIQKTASDPTLIQGMTGSLEQAGIAKKEAAKMSRKFVSGTLELARGNIYPIFNNKPVDWSFSQNVRRGAYFTEDVVPTTAREQEQGYSIMSPNKKGPTGSTDESDH